MSSSETERDDKTETYDLSDTKPFYVDEKGNKIKAEEDLTSKARKAADAFYDLVASAAQKAKQVTKEKTKEIVSKGLDAGAVSASKDARDISALGPMVEELARHFEETDTTITEQSYANQTELFLGYKKLLEEQIKVIDARLHYVKRL